jgi:hypothetical protein
MKQYDAIYIGGAWVAPACAEEEAVRIANSTPYGLAGAVWSSNMEHALAEFCRVTSIQEPGGATPPEGR